MTLAGHHPFNQVRVEPTTDPQGVTVIDDIQGIRVSLGTTEPVIPLSGAPTAFCFPVDVAYDIDTESVRIPMPVNVCVRDHVGSVVADVPPNTSKTLGQGQYTVEIGGLGVKTYLAVQSELRIPAATDGGRTISVENTDPVGLGVRSLHNQPATTVTTTDDPTDVMRALSCFGASLKTTSCERSFPSMRGHPPQIKHGDCFDAPATLERTPAETDIQIEVPSTFEYIYPVASLAYYLNAAVVPGDSPRLLVDGTAHPIEHEDGYDAAVFRLLKHLFTLDCLTRTEGFYPVQLAGREQIEESAGLDFAALYDQSLGEQVNTYLTVPFETVASIVPRWPLTTTIAPTAAHLGVLSYVAADLSSIRTPETERSVTTRAGSQYAASINEFLRGTSTTAPSFRGQSSATADQQIQQRGPSDDSTDGGWTRALNPPSTGSITHLWFNDGYPIAGAKPTLDACQRRLDAHSSGPIDVAVISNAPEMHDETDVADLYGMRDLIAFDVTVYEECSQTALREILMTEYDLIHYIGHVTDEGLQCDDGWLDAATLDHVETRAFILNGCRSVDQGMALVESGAIGGLCTLSGVANTSATDIGRTVARLLNAGFSLGGSLDIITDTSVTGYQYMVVGDPRLTITTCKGTAATLAEIHSIEKDQYKVSIHGFPAPSTSLGALSMPYLGNEKEYSLNSGQLVTKTVTTAELQAHLELGRVPVRHEGTLTWSDMLTGEEGLSNIESQG
ncbi:hypothetical protein [Halocatena marina]|uniref:hypothetical protein n=1 Tax=Halocatena marina TaxID=2934937 RepID=UPI00200DBD8D|nr:hypothetical protein [Halocatena marina]